VWLNSGHAAVRAAGARAHPSDFPGRGRVRATVLAAALASWMAPPVAQAFVKSVEYAEIVIDATKTSTTANLTRNQVVANCVPFASSMADSGVDGFGNAFTDVFLTAGSPPTVTVQRDLTGGTVTVGVYVVEFDPAYVRVQQAPFSLASGTAGPVTAGLAPAVDLARAALVFYTRNDFPSGSNGYNDVTVEGWFSATNQLSFQRNTTQPTINGHWYVFEALNVSGSYVFAVQPKTFTFATATGTSTALSPSVGSTETFVVGSYRTALASDHADRGSFRLFLSGCSGSPSTCTSVTAESYAGASSVTVTAFAITFPSGVRVQRGALSYTASGGTSTLQTAALSPAFNMSQTMVWNGFGMAAGIMRANESSGDQMFMAQHRLKMAAPTSVQGNRGAVGVVAVGTWEAVEFATATAVELQSFSAAARDSAVDLQWTTATELQNLGFHLYRAPDADGPFDRITAHLIPGLGSSPTGASYSYRDTGLTNGTPYFYLLEDVETTGRTERHGPVTATPGATGTGEGDGSGGGGGSGGGSDGAGDGSDDPGDGDGAGGSGRARITWGDPSAVSLRIAERGPAHALLELLTPGFTAVTDADGTVRISIPGFEDTASAGALAVPVRRALVEALAGRQVRMTSVQADDVVTFDGFRLAAAVAREVVVTESGIVKAGAGRRRLLESSRSGGLTPRLWARLDGSVFQGETKKARVELTPLRHDPGTGRTVLARRLFVRLEFVGVEAGERSLGGSRGRRPGGTSLVRSKGVVAQVVARQAGLYRVRFEDVFGTARRGVSAAGLRLSHLDEPVAYHIEPDRALFGPGGSLFFVSEGAAQTPRDEVVYELSLGQAALRMGRVSAAPSGPDATEYAQTLRLEQNRFYQSALLQAPDLWLWDLLVSPVTKTYAFTVDSLSASSTPSRLRVVLQGASDFEGLDHHVRLSVNGMPVAEATWDGKVEQVVEAEVSAGIVVDGANSLSVENAGDAGAAYSMVFLNHFEMSHPRLLAASGGRLEGTFGDSGRAEILGLTSPAFVLDTTSTPAWLTSAEPTPSGLAFRAEAGRRYLAVAESALLAPEVRRAAPARLKGRAHRAHWVLIGPREFLPAAQPLVDLRRAQGLRTMTVALEDVAAEFGYGEASPEAIHDFLRYAFHNWRTKPRYVVLLGDSTYDPKNYLGTGVKDRLPTPIALTSYLWTASDPTLAAVNGEDSLPDLALGRLSAGTFAEAQRLVNKLVAFEQAGRSFEGKAVLVADNADLAGSFEADQDEIASLLIADHEVEKVYLRDLGGATRDTIRAAFDSGPGLVSYVGHGATAVWASENVWNNTDIAGLGGQDQQPLLLTLNCLNGFFHFPPFDSLAEAFVKAEGKGAIAAFAPSGLSIDAAAHLYHKALLTEIEAGGHLRLGDAVLAAQQDYADTGAMPELLSIYHLFGDPGMKIR